MTAPRGCSLLAALAAVAALAGLSAAAEPIDLSDCRIDGLAEVARCGELRVPENPEAPDDRQITIAIAVLPATGGDALPDPILPLYGGPGEQVIGEAGYVARQFAALRARRDILLVDQRGVGRSSPLRCRLFDPEAPAPNLRHFLPPAAVEACARELSSRADLTQYTYLHFAHDLERVREALGYAQFNLNAGSYGTRAAQVFMRAYPKSVRTAYLGSVVPLDYVTPLTMAKASQQAFEATFAACGADANCRAAYPELRREFDEVLARLDAGEVHAAMPGDTEAPLARGRAVEWLRARLYRPAGAAEVPWLIHRAHTGDWSPFIEGILAQAREVDDAYALGLWLSITCSEDLAFLRAEDIAPASAGTYLRDYRVREQANACRSWPKARLPDGYREPLRSSIPTMFVSGDMDAATPLSFTAHVAQGFPNRVEIVARGQGHTEPNDCVAQRYRQFVESGSARGIDPVCPAIPRPPFKLR